MTQRIEGKFAAHDRHHFELKLGYSLNPEEKNNKYNIELYYFIPKSLGINHHTYSKRQFYNDIQGYIRFKTPTFSFEALADQSNLLSPLTKIKKLLEGDPERKRLIAEIKLFACTLRVALRNDITYIRRKLRKGETGELTEKIRGTCEGLKRCLHQFRSLGPKLGQPNVDDDARTAYRHADEYIGIAVDGLLNSIHNTTTDSITDRTLSTELNSTIMPLIKSEFDYRKSKGYAVYTTDSENELFLYRKGILKKIITNILFLNTHTEESLTNVRELIFATAAGIAMLIFVGFSFWAGQRWSATSMPFAMALIIGYIVKDRFKDWFKILFSNRMTRWFADLKTDILDPATDDKIGICRQAFSFLTEKAIPKQIFLLRRQNTAEEFWIPEDIVKYEKDVILLPKHILKKHTRRRDVTDIIRFNIHQFLERMDEPFEIRRALDTQTEDLVEFKCARVYHVNLILKLEDELRRIRLILNQNGIVRIEEVK